MGVQEILQKMKGVCDLGIRHGMREFQWEMWNDASFADLPENQQLGLLGEAAWVAYLGTRDIKAVAVHEKISANGPDIVGYALRNGSIILTIGEVKATRKIPGRCWDNPADAATTSRCFPDRKSPRPSISKKRGIKPGSSEGVRSLGDRFPGAFRSIRRNG